MKKGMIAVLLTLALAVATVISMAVPAAADPVNLITNGDFEAGNTGFTTDYIYLDPSIQGGWTLGPPYMYTIGTNPGLYHSAWLPGFGDHTSGTGKMMIVNGSSNGAPPELVWGQDVTLTSCVPTYPVTTYKLYADGGAWEAGEVQVKTSETGICVRILLTDQRGDPDNGWLITQMHVAVAATCAGIPQKNGNPIPGLFPLNLTFTPGTLDTDWQCLEYEWTAGTPLCIAAHAKIEHAEVGHMQQYEFCATSNPFDTDVVTATGIEAAVIPGVDPWGNLDVNVNNIPDCEEIANYLWGANAMTSDVADNGGMVDFMQNFSIIGTPTSATFKIAADNAFAYSFNGGDEVAENLAYDWRTQAALGNFDWPSVVIDPNPSGWSMVYTYDVLSKMLSGSNVLNVTGVNADWNTTSWNVNPATVIYKLCGTSEQYVVDQPYDSETGWGEGTPFSGKNWASCISYTPQVVCDYGSYLLEFYAASSYPAAPAQLEVKINGVVVPPTLEATATPGQWVKYSAVWNAGTATHANIEIRDLRDTYSGDDFVIDDISLVKV